MGNSVTGVANGARRIARSRSTVARISIERGLTSSVSPAGSALSANCCPFGPGFGSSSIPEALAMTGYEDEQTPKHRRTVDSFCVLQSQF